MTNKPRISEQSGAEILFGSCILWCEILNPEDGGLLLLVPGVKNIPDFFTLRINSGNAEHLARIVLRRKAENGVLLLVRLLDPKE